MQHQSKEDFCQKFVYFQASGYQIFEAFDEHEVNAHYLKIALKGLTIFNHFHPFELIKVDLNADHPNIFLLPNRNSIQVFLRLSI